MNPNPIINVPRKNHLMHVSIEPLVVPDRSRTLVSMSDRVLPHLQRGEHALVVLIDGVGFDSAKAAAEMGVPLFSWAEEQKLLQQHSAQFPATTTAQITSLHLRNTPVEKHGLYEWVTYHPDVGLISALPFSRAREGKRDTLYELGVKPEDVYPTESVYRFYDEQGFHSVLAMPDEIIDSPFNTILCPSTSQKLGFSTVQEGCRKMVEAIQQASSPTYFYFYIDLMDKTSHTYTKESPEFERELAATLTALRDNLFASLKDFSRGCQVFVTSDHGHMTITEETHINECVPAIDSYLQRDKQGKVIPCSGGFRSCFLHALPEKQILLRDILRERLSGKAVVLTLDEAMDRGFFDRALCSERFLESVGNILILSLDGHAVYYHISGKFDHKMRSVHGGASQAEMTTPYIEFPLGDFLVNKI
jgi:hypothetical protein